MRSVRVGKSQHGAVLQELQTWTSTGVSSLGQDGKEPQLRRVSETSSGPRGGQRSRDERVKQPREEGFVMKPRAEREPRPGAEAKAEGEGLFTTAFNFILPVFLFHTLKILSIKSSEIVSPVESQSTWFMED